MGSQSQMWLNNFTFSFKWDHKELLVASFFYALWIILSPFCFSIDYFFLWWIWFQSWHLCEFRCFLLCSKPYIQYSVPKMLTSLHNLRISVSVPKFFTMFLKIILYKSTVFRKVPGVTVFLQDKQLPGWHCVVYYWVALC